MKKYICFDIGNVLFDVDFSGIQSYMYSSWGISYKHTSQFLQYNQKICDLGLTTVIDDVIQYFHIKPDDIYLSGVEIAWLECIKPNIEMITLLADLQMEGWKIALLSNMGSEHKSKVAPMFMDYIRFLSCDIGARKPTTLFFKTFIDLYPDFANAIYIDDLQENLDAGKSFGLKPMRFDLTDLANKNIDALKEEIKNSQNA